MNGRRSQCNKLKHMRMSHVFNVILISYDRSLPIARRGNMSLCVISLISVYSFLMYWFKGEVSVCLICWTVIPCTITEITCTFYTCGSLPFLNLVVQLCLLPVECNSLHFMYYIVAVHCRCMPCCSTTDSIFISFLELTLYA